MTSTSRRAPTTIQEIRSVRAWVIRITASVSALEARCAAIDKKLDQVLAELRYQRLDVGISSESGIVPLEVWRSLQAKRYPLSTAGGQKIPKLSPAEIVTGFDDPE